MVVNHLGWWHTWLILTQDGSTMVFYTHKIVPHMVVAHTLWWHTQ